MEFNLKADILFEAENIDKAFEILADHFNRLANEEDSALKIKGTLEIKEVKLVKSGK